MEPAALCFENLKRLFDMMISHKSRTRHHDISPQLLTFALSSELAFSALANYAKTSFQVRHRYSNLYVGCYKDPSFTSEYNDGGYEDRNFITACRKYISRVFIGALGHSEDHIKICDYLAGMASLEEINMSAIHMHLTCGWYDNVEKMKEYRELLSTNARFSTLIVNRFFFVSLQTTPDTNHFPNLTKLVIREDTLSNIDVSKLTRHSCPVLNSAHFLDSRLSKNGVTKLAKFCNVMQQTISDVVVTLSKAANVATNMNHHIEYQALISKQFEKIKFHHKFLLTVNGVVGYIDDAVFEKAGFGTENGQLWVCKKEFGDTSVVYNVSIE
uniref:Uncharacterized protein n=1 Tax=Panagrellus redivivus TaxID=6233 RepID=A0A7E4UTY7_PANRE